MTAVSCLVLGLVFGTALLLLAFAGILIGMILPRRFRRSRRPVGSGR